MKNQSQGDAHTLILDTWIQHFCTYHHIPGVAVGILREGAVHYQHCFGVSNLATHDPITPRTYFHIASISKSITATAIFKLIAEKKISLTTPVARILPEICLIQSAYPLHHITVEHLLSHTSGLARDGVSGHWENDQFPTRDELRTSLPHLTTYAPAGTQFKYSNLGYAFLGLLIETVSGDSYERYIQKNILIPRGLRTLHVDTADTTASYATGYGLLRYGNPRPSYLHPQTHAFAPATGYGATLQQLLKLLRFFDPRDARTLLSTSAHTNILKHKVPTEHGETYGLGFEIEHHGTHTLIGHTGGFAGFSTKMLYDHKRRLGAVVLMNTHESRSGDMMSGILNTYDDSMKIRTITHPPHIFGHYQSRYDDIIIAPYGKHLLAFNPKHSSPTREGILLTPTRDGTYRVTRSSPYDAYGESVTFIQKNSTSPAHTMLLGAHPYTRVI